MTCQHPVFGTAALRGPLPLEAVSEPFDPESPWFEPILFQPVADTFEHRILAYECVSRGFAILSDEPARLAQAARLRALSIQSAARQNPHGLYLFNLAPSSIADPRRDLQATCDATTDSGMDAGSVVFDISEPDLARERDHSRRILEYLRGNGFGFALSGAGLAPATDSIETIAEFKPAYIKVDGRLIRDIDRPASAATVSKLARIAERSGAHLIAEGVDRVKMLENLWLLGVQFMQGHLFGEPSSRIA
jgi:EAL domain-containing protein (putative c-di-GMP-specific phosphodiesterase class I)